MTPTLRAFFLNAAPMFAYCIALVQLARAARSKTVTWRRVVLFGVVAVTCSLWSILTGSKSFLPHLIGTVTLMGLMLWKIPTPPREH